MKFILGALAVAGLVSSSSSIAATLTVGGPLSHSCYESARGADGRSSALEACTRALEEESLGTADRSATYVNRGIVLMSAGRYAEADADFDTALRLQPNLADSWLNKAYLRLRQGDGRGALEMINVATHDGAAPNAEVFFARGVAHEQAGELEAAYSDLERARSLAPGWSLPKSYLATYRVGRR